METPNTKKKKQSILLIFFPDLVKWIQLGIYVDPIDGELKNKTPNSKFI